MLNRPVAIAFLVLLAVLGFGDMARAQSAVAITPLSSDAVLDGDGWELATGWRFHSGDDPAWASVDADTSTWEAIDSPRLPIGKRPAGGWSGIGWFRNEVDVPEDLVHRSLGVVMSHFGASEVFVDGQRIGGFGTVGATAAGERARNPRAQPIPFEFPSAGRHVIAVRYSCQESADSTRTLYPKYLSAGFAFYLADGASAIDRYGDMVRGSTFVPMVLVGVLATLGLIHLLLFAFNREQRANLYYSGFVLSFGANVITQRVISFGGLGYNAQMAFVAVSRALIALIFISFLLFLSEAFGRPRSRLFYTIGGIWIVTLLLALIYPQSAWVLYVMMAAISFSIAEGFFILGSAFRLKVEGAWIIGTGVILYVAGLTAELSNRLFNLDSDLLGVLSLCGVLGLPLCVSVYLAWQVGRSRSHIASLERENERKALELEEARQLQLSMLPKSVPSIPGLTIAAYMKPATEVGGDYYDFHVGDDGTLTVAVGDATGHGLKAGTLVTATKGLFNAFAAEASIPEIFRRSSSALKLLNLKYLYMALTLVKMRGNRVTVSAAGMPPMLVHRAATGEVDEIVIRGLPLGGAANFPYVEEEIVVNPGDTVVLMSDGFPERFNAAGEMLDYARAAEVLRATSGASPEMIIARFVETAESWGNGHPQDDDITFVVVRID